MSTLSFLLLEILSQITGYSHKITIMPPAGANRCSPNNCGAAQAWRSAAAKRNVIPHLNPKKNGCWKLLQSICASSIVIPVLNFWKTPGSENKQGFVLCIMNPDNELFNSERMHMWASVCMEDIKREGQRQKTGSVCPGEKSEEERLQHGTEWQRSLPADLQLAILFLAFSSSICLSPRSKKKWQRMRYQREGASGGPLD